MTELTFHNLGNADSILIILGNGRRILKPHLVVGTAPMRTWLSSVSSLTPRATPQIHSSRQSFLV